MKVLKVVGGVALIIIGFVALVTPLTPGAWLMFVGLELIGVRLVAWDRIKAWFTNWRASKKESASENPTITKKTK